MVTRKVLIVDDEDGIRFAIRDFLEAKGYDVIDADTCAAATRAFIANRPDAAILDYRLPDGDAFELLPGFREIDPNCPVIILTAYGSIDLAVRAIKEGAEQFLTKPIELPALEVILERVLEHQRNRRTSAARKTRQERQSIDPFLGSSPAIAHLAADVHQIIDADCPILLQGETGTGKSVLARWIHENSMRAQEAFVDLNCAGLSSEFLESELFGHVKGAFTGATSTKTGLLDVAHRGTILLDEIADVPVDVQPKLLKVLEDSRFRRLGDVRDRWVDVRIVAASNQPLARLVKEKKFRSDLYFRICTIPVVIPPLRERIDDIAALAEMILRRLAISRAGPTRLSNSGLQALKTYAWPGNIRELRNVLERAVLFSRGDSIGPADLRFDASVEPPEGMDTSLTLQELEARHIERVLKEVNGHVGRAAERLDIPRSTLYQRIKKYRISVPRA